MTHTTLHNGHHVLFDPETLCQWVVGVDGVLYYRGQDEDEQWASWNPVAVTKETQAFYDTANRVPVAYLTSPKQRLTVGPVLRHQLENEAPECCGKGLSLIPNLCRICESCQTVYVWSVVHEVTDMIG